MNPSTRCTESCPAPPSACFDHFRAGFVGQLDALFLPDGERMELDAPFGFLDKAGRLWQFPAGLLFNGASIGILGESFKGRYRRAAALHDLAYCTGLWENREWADRMFYEAMILDGCNKVAAWVMWKAVRVAGGRYYGGERKCDGE